MPPYRITDAPQRKRDLMGWGRAEEPGSSSGTAQSTISPSPTSSSSQQTSSSSASIVSVTPSTPTPTPTTTSTGSTPPTTTTSSTSDVPSNTPTPTPTTQSSASDSKTLKLEATFSSSSSESSPAATLAASVPSTARSEAASTNSASTSSSRVTTSKTSPTTSSEIVPTTGKSSSLSTTKDRTSPVSTPSSKPSATNTPTPTPSSGSDPSPTNTSPTKPEKPTTADFGNKNGPSPTTTGGDDGTSAPTLDQQPTASPTKSGARPAETSGDPSPSPSPSSSSPSAAINGGLATPTTTSPDADNAPSAPAKSPSPASKAGSNGALPSVKTFSVTTTVPFTSSGLVISVPTVIPTTSSVTPTGIPGSEARSPSNQAGMIAGSVIGSLAALGLGVFLIFFLRRRRRVRNEWGIYGDSGGGGEWGSGHSSPWRVAAQRLFRSLSHSGSKVGSFFRRKETSERAHIRNYSNDTGGSGGPSLRGFLVPGIPHLPPIMRQREPVFTMMPPETMTTANELGQHRRLLSLESNLSDSPFADPDPFRSEPSSSVGHGSGEPATVTKARIPSPYGGAALRAALPPTSPPSGSPPPRPVSSTHEASASVIALIPDSVPLPEPGSPITKPMTSMLVLNSPISPNDDTTPAAVSFSSSPRNNLNGIMALSRHRANAINPFDDNYSADGIPASFSTTSIYSVGTDRTSVAEDGIPKGARRDRELHASDIFVHRDDEERNSRAVSSVSSASC